MECAVVSGLVVVVLQGRAGLLSPSLKRGSIGRG